jgi:hypothetical protein
MVINDVLWRDWDPLDVSDDPTTLDTYKSYIPTILRLLLNESHPAEVADALWKIEEEELQLSISQADTVDAANMLVNEAIIFEEEHPRPTSIN